MSRKTPPTPHPKIDVYNWAGLIIWAVAGTVVAFGLFVLFWWGFSRISPYQTSDDVYNVVRDAIAAAGVITVGGGAAVALRRQRTVEHNTNIAQANTQIAEDAELTNRYTKAVSQLANKSVHIRLGGIYALERLAEDSARDRTTIIDVIAAFIRDKSPGRKQGSGDDQGTVEQLPTDIAAALTVLGRIPNKSPAHTIDLHSIQASGAALSGAHLTGADLTGAELIRADLTGAHLTEAHLTRAELTGANLATAILFGANLTRANLTRAHLTRAHLTRANLTRSALILADLTEAYLTGADLTQANLTEANLTGADLTGANLTGSCWLDSRPPLWPGGLVIQARSGTGIETMVSWEWHPGKRGSAEESASTS